ncbi:MAG: archaeal/vacuolar-type H+ ATPase subunit E [Candidatus Nanosalina sp. J07AB43]|jgi:Archaeal/vacuolar-type H+-ATPase subunit E|nr:MAG: archaeal/vacuolar-type H+ ATPase subunit E [Candidatus Nanosalina sp. J07AB43]
MGLEEVKSDILEEAQQKSDEIIGEAEEEEEEILEEASKESSKIKKEVNKELERKKDSLEKQELSNARMKAKQEKLKAKQKELERAFNEFRDDLSNLDEDERKSFVQNVIEETDFEVAKVKGSEEFEGLKEDVEFEEIEEEGIILESEDGSTRRDFTFDRIVENFREEHRKDVAEMLFPEGEQ